MYFLPASSSEVVHHKAVEEMRDMDFNAFEQLVLRRLGKEVQLKPALLQKKQVTIKYKDENNTTCNYKYNLPAIEEEEDESQDRQNCFTACRAPPVEQKRLTIVGQMHVIKMNFWHHLREMRIFLKREENLQAEGIFLKAGSQENQKILRDEMKTSRSINFSKLNCSVYDCANVLKHFLHQMPEPLFPSKYYLAYERIARIESSYAHDDSERRNLVSHSPVGCILPPASELMLKEKKLLDCLQLMVNLLPHTKREIFEQVLDILEAVYKYRSYNRMSATSLGSIFAPLLMTPRNLPREVVFSVSRDMATIISRMIKMGKDVLGEPVKLRLDVWEYMRTPAPPSKYDKQRVSILFDNNF